MAATEWMTAYGSVAVRRPLFMARRAFFYAEATEAVFVEFPDEGNEPGALGLPCAARKKTKNCRTPSTTAVVQKTRNSS